MIQFVLVGFGYRAQFYVRIAQVLPQDFKIIGVYVKDEVSKQKVLKKTSLFVTSNIDDIKQLNPDFVVNTSPKTITFDISMQFIAQGYKVLQETPLALTEKEIEYIWQNKAYHHYYQIAEQYHKYPSIESLLTIVNQNMIGDVTELYISAMHDYHAISMIRAFLNVSFKKATITGKIYTSDIERTLTRYEQFFDGSKHEIEKTHMIIDFHHKHAVYDFSSEQYRSPIRHKKFHIKGTKGEIIDDKVYYLDHEHKLKEEHIITTYHNQEIIKITCESRILYEVDPKGLNEDETAIASLLYLMKDFCEGKKDVYPLSYALEDAYLSILMKKFNQNNYQTITIDEREFMI